MNKHLLVFCLLSMKLLAEHSSNSSLTVIGTNSERAIALVASSNHKDMAYDFCKGLKSAKYKKDCAKVVSNAQFYDKGAIRFCKTFKYYWYKIYCIDQLRNSNFEAGALDVCLEVSDKKLILPPPESKKLDCALDIAKPTIAIHTSSDAAVTLLAPYPEIFGQMEVEAAKVCKGWETYYFRNANWKYQDCYPYGAKYYCKTNVYCTKKSPMNQRSILYSGLVE